MSDDWKGLHLIKSKPKSREERRSESNALVSRLGHKKRTAQGCNMAAVKGPWAETIQRWQLRGKIERGQG